MIDIQTILIIDKIKTITPILKKNNLPLLNEDITITETKIDSGKTTEYKLYIAKIISETNKRNNISNQDRITLSVYTKDILNKLNQK